MEVVYVMGVLVSEWIKYHLFLRQVLKVEFQRYWIIAVEAGVVLSIFFFGERTLKDIPIFIYAWVVIIGLFFQINEKWIKKFAYIMSSFFVLTCFDEISVFFAGVFMNIQMNGNQYITDVYLFSNIFIIVVLLMAALIRKKISIKLDTEKLQIIIYFMMAFVGIVLTMTISLLQYITTYLQDNRIVIVSQIMAVISFIGMIFLGGMLFYIIHLNKELKDNLEIEQELKVLQKNYFELMLEKEDDTRKFRHDIGNHLICIHDLGMRNKMPELIEYVGNIQNELKMIRDKLYYTGNDVIDSLLNYYLLNLNRNIKIQIVGRLANQIGISSMDLCTIFSNVLCNAVEELSKDCGEQDFLNIEFRNGENYFKIKIENSSKSYSAYEGKIPQTQKANKKEHGFGLMNVKRTVEKIGGYITIEHNNKKFVIAMVLPKTTV